MMIQNRPIRKYRHSLSVLACAALLACQPSGCQNAPNQTSVKLTTTKASATPTPAGTVIIRGHVGIKGGNLAPAEMKAYDAFTDQLLNIPTRIAVVTNAKGQFSLAVQSLAQAAAVKIVAQHRSGNLSAIMLPNGQVLAAPTSYRLNQDSGFNVEISPGSTMLTRMLLPTMKIAKQIDSKFQSQALEKIVREAAGILTQANQQITGKAELADTIIGKTTTAGEMEDASLAQLIDTLGLKQSLQTLVVNAAKELQANLAAGGTIDEAISTPLTIPGINVTVTMAGNSITVKGADGNTLFSGDLKGASPQPSPAASSASSPPGAGGGGGGFVPPPSAVPDPSNPSLFLPSVDTLAITGGGLNLTVSQTANQQDIRYVVVRMRRKNAAGADVANFKDNFAGNLNNVGGMTVKVPATAPAFNCTIAPVAKLSNTLTLPERLGAGIQLQGGDAIYTGQLTRSSDNLLIATVQIFENASFVYVATVYALTGGIDLNRGHITTISIPLDRWDTLTTEAKPEIYLESRQGNTTDLDKTISGT